MKRISSILCPAVILTASVLSPAPVQACAPLMQPNYILNQGNAYYPVLEIDHALNYFIEGSGDLFRNTPVYKDGLETPAAEAKDFAAALKKYCPGMPEAEQKKLSPFILRTATRITRSAQAL